MSDGNIVVTLINETGEANGINVMSVKIIANTSLSTLSKRLERQSFSLAPGLSIGVGLAPDQRQVVVTLPDGAQPVEDQSTPLDVNAVVWNILPGTNVSLGLAGDTWLAIADARYSS